MPDDRRKPSPASGRTLEGGQVRTVEVESDSESQSLSALEDRVLKARRGAGVPDDFRLPQKDEGLSDEVKERLRALEQQAFKAAGRVAELQQEAAEEENDLEQRLEVKARIIDQLKGEDPAP